MRFWLIASGVTLVGAVLTALLLRMHFTKRRAQRKRERLKAIHPFLAGPAISLRPPTNLDNDDSDA